MPVVFNSKDGMLVLEHLLKKNKISKGYQIFDDTVLVTDKFLEMQTEQIINTIDTKVKKVKDQLEYIKSIIVFIF